MSKQQDELREQIHILLIDYDHAGMWQRSASKEIMKLVNSTVQAVLDKVKMVDEVSWSEMNLDEVCGSYDEAFEQGGNKQRTKFIEAIEEVRKDYE